MHLMRLHTRFLFFCALTAAAALVLATKLFFDERKALSAVIERLSADSRIAEAMVTASQGDPLKGPPFTTIKFVEYDHSSRPLPPKYFTFRDNLIQFQSLVIRFDDFFIKKGHRLKGKSAYVFLKVFSLESEAPQVYEINHVGAIPDGYRLPAATAFQRRLWRQFWRYALDDAQARAGGIKNAQVEAPGTRFIPGMLYTIKIEHDGGMRIDARPLPSILQGERTAPR